MADEQQTPVGRQARELGERLASVEGAGQRRVQPSRPRCCALQCSAASSAVWRARILGLNRIASKLARSALEREPCRMGLFFAALGQTALCVHACAVGLSVSVT